LNTSEDLHLEQSLFHSVHLHEDRCKGCTVCVTGCPVEAIRVRNGKASILEEVCIDCGECIRTCPNKAKYADAAENAVLHNFDYTAALVTPAIYGQFNLHYSVAQIHRAFQLLGFSEVFDVAEDALSVSRATAEIIDSYAAAGEQSRLSKPFISSSCPTVVKLIQVRYPALLDNLLPLLPPVEIAARRARRVLTERAGADKKVGVFLISPCSAKITVARAPLGYAHSAMDGAFSFSALYLPLLEQLRGLRQKEKESLAGASAGAPAYYHDAPDGLAWGREGGEAQYIMPFLKHPESFNWITCCGLTQIKETLEAIEDGQMNEYDFAEIAACPGGCLGGPLLIRPVSESSALLRTRIHNSTGDSPAIADNTDINLQLPLLPRPSRQLSSDFGEARKMMEELESIAEMLPGLDCGSCGAPNCRALAEDIVRKKAHLEDCVTIMKSRYEALLFGDTEKNG
jgi:iron only hydrogenase large subunit-like protein